MKAIDDLYYYLVKLEEAYSTEGINYQDYLAINEAREKLESAISNIEIILTESNLPKDPVKSV